MLFTQDLAGRHALPASSRNWYAGQCSKQSAQVYAKETHQTEFASFNRLDRGLGKLQRRRRGPEISSLNRNFADPRIGEHLAASIPFALRYFGCGIGPVARVRFPAWSRVRYEAMREMTGELAVAT